MIKDFLISFSDNFKEKTKNPLLGTYLLVWLIRNWDLVYTLFNFDKDCTLDDKKRFVFEYYRGNDFIENLIINILWSFGLLIITYILLNISRFFVNISEKRLTPWIYKITDSKSIVLKPEYERIRSENDDLQFRLDKERESKLRLENRIKSLESEIIEITRAQAETEVPDLNSKSEIADSNSILLKKLESKSLVQSFLDVCTSINRGDSIPNANEDKDYFIELGLIKYNGFSSGSSKRYSVTTDGEKVLKKLRTM